jgi:hypothetical protein
MRTVLTPGAGAAICRPIRVAAVTPITAPLHFITPHSQLGTTSAAPQPLTQITTVNQGTTAATTWPVTRSPWTAIAITFITSSSHRVSILFPAIAYFRAFHWVGGVFLLIIIIIIIVIVGAVICACTPPGTTTTTSPPAAPPSS